MIPRHCPALLALAFVFSLHHSVAAQTLEQQLLAVSPSQLAAEALQSGDAARGAILFHQPQSLCSRCHSTGQSAVSLLGPDLTALPADTTDAHLVESVLQPSKEIRRGYESVTVVLTDGRSLSGLVAERTAAALILRDAARGGEPTVLSVDSIDEVVPATVSLMPAGQTAALASRQQFLDLIRYLSELRTGGVRRARELQPPAALLTLQIPQYEQSIDHAGFIRDLDDAALQRGEAIYRRVCQNCHGTKDQAGSLPTSLRFAEGRFRSGSDPFTMYQTLTRGFGLMAAQTWMVPSQKYDVIHYIRQTMLKPYNPSQYFEVQDAWLAGLPAGDSRGPEPSTIQPWNAMDYGPSLTHSYEVPTARHNIAQKGLAVRLDAGSGGIARGRHWMLFDTDTLRMAAAWSAPEKPDSERNFIDWRGIQFNGEHQIHPTISGLLLAGNADGPGWASPQTGSFADDRRVEGRDGRRYGPLPREWGRFRGQYFHDQQVILHYGVGSADILELPALRTDDRGGQPAFLRTFNIGPRDHDLLLQVAELPGSALTKVQTPAGVSNQPDVVRFGPAEVAGEAAAAANLPVHFDGGTWLQSADAKPFDLTQSDFTITARVRTQGNGTLFALARPTPQWTPDGQSLFIRGGRLVYDIGWVGAVESRRRVNDGRWHDVAAVWTKSSRRLQLWIDGRPDAEGELSARQQPQDAVLRIGFTAGNFPQPDSYLTGELQTVSFFQRALSQELSSAEKLAAAPGLVARWQLDAAVGSEIAAAGAAAVRLQVQRGAPSSRPAPPIFAGVSAAIPGLQFQADGDRLVLRIPAGTDPLRFSLWLSETGRPVLQTAPGQLPLDADLRALTKGGPARWPQRLTTQVQTLFDGGPLAQDSLTPPEINPWLAQLRMTGLDFFADGRMAVCTWDGDVWVVSGLPAGPELSWQRIATGLYQPLGLKIIDETIYLTCRDQLAVLRDLNGDGETDFVECLNSDHQVTEHFHEFAMGLQTDAAGNFYYAKSGRHALPAVVPQHGTLLKVTPDGSRTEILAVGFRAANGVCLNPDGSFVVTDQEGFWNPKNRINWVLPPADGQPKFYGNMLGYHGVQDESDSAMEPPLCWITNEFDRSPGELLWVDSDRWGPLQGSLLNLSYGYGKVFLVLHEQTGGRRQGGMIELPMPAFPTGVMRGRFNPADGQLYVCGMFAWAGSATHPGGLYRLRLQPKPLHLPLTMHAVPQGLQLSFSEPLDPASVAPAALQVKAWDLKRTAGYGSKHFNERPWPVTAATLSADGLTLSLTIPDLQPTWGMEVSFDLRAVDGGPVRGRIHNTIHVTGETAGGDR